MSLKNSSPSHAVDLALEAIANRKNHSAKRLVSPGPTQSQINRIFGAAASAPDHGRETPWRFVVICEDKRHLLGEAFANALHERDNNALDENQAVKKAYTSHCSGVSTCCGLRWFPKPENLIQFILAEEELSILVTYATNGTCFH